MLHLNLCKWFFWKFFFKTKKFSFSSLKLSSHSSTKYFRILDALFFQDKNYNKKISSISLIFAIFKYCWQILHVRSPILYIKHIYILCIDKTYDKGQYSFVITEIFKKFVNMLIHIWWFSTLNKNKYHNCYKIIIIIFLLIRKKEFLRKTLPGSERKTYSNHESNILLQIPHSCSWGQFLFVLKKTSQAVSWDPGGAVEKK